MKQLFFVALMLLSAGSIEGLSFTWNEQVRNHQILFPSKPEVYKNGERVALSWVDEKSGSRLVLSCDVSFQKKKNMIHDYFTKLLYEIWGRKVAISKLRNHVTGTICVELENKSLGSDSTKKIFFPPEYLNLNKLEKSFGKAIYGKSIKLEYSPSRQVSEYELQYERGIGFIRIECMSNENGETLALFIGHKVERQDFDTFVTGFQPKR